MTPKELFEQKIASHLAQNPSLVQALEAIYQFQVLGEQGGFWFIEISNNQGKVQSGVHENPNCHVTIEDSDLIHLVNGELSPQWAFMSGKLKIKGDFGLALKLGQILKP